MPNGFTLYNTGDKSHLQVVEDDAGAEQVIIDADEMRKFGVQDHTNSFLPQS